MNLRIDRLTTLYVVDPLRRYRLADKTSIPILMYHSIADEDESRVHPYYRTTTAPSVFTLHMQYLHDHGYRTINLPDAVGLLRNGTSPQKCAVITFDDGYSDFYKHAFPTLNRYSFTATVFLPTDYIGRRRTQFNAKDCLTWREVRELLAQNMSFGSHTVTHPQLRTLDESAVTREIVKSKNTIENEIGELVESFSYPFAFPEGNTSFTQKLRDTLKKAGYRQGVSTRIGLARRGEDQYFLRRLPMNTLDDIALFSAKLRGGYDWLHGLQYSSKLLAAWH
jgi:peptidoglycan/xylan/chitin deacetylase (PgdA/CDA1 family)